MKSINLLFLSWRDIKSKKMGGAEIFTHEMLKRLDPNVYKIVHFSPRIDGLPEEEVIDGVRYMRKGNLLTVIVAAMRYYQSQKYNFDYVIDQCNTHRFFTPLWVPKVKRIFFIHQLTREIWFKNLKMPLSLLGYLTETPLLRLSRKDNSLTVSQSTKNDLLAVGFHSEKTHILPEGINFEHWQESAFLEKAERPTFMYIGRFVKYKGIDDSIAAFAAFKKTVATGQLLIAGKKNQAYFESSLLPIIEANGLTWGSEIDGPEDIIFLGFIDEMKKLELMSQSHALIFPSLREGWGLTITEAAAVGTPSIVFNSPGVIDAVNFGQAGYLCDENAVSEITRLMIRVCFETEEYQRKQQEAYDFSLNFHWKHTAESFDNYMRALCSRKEM